MGVSTGPSGAGLLPERPTFILVLTEVGPLVKDCPGGTNALKGTWRVLTLAAITHHGIQQTFVLVHTLLAGHINLVSLVANTPVAADQVLTGSLSANIGIPSTLVDVVAAVGEPGSVGTQLLVLSRSRVGAGRAGVPPTHQMGGWLRVAAAGRLGDH